MKKIFSFICIALMALLVANAGASQVDTQKEPRMVIPIKKAKSSLPLESSESAANTISITGYFMNESGQGLSAAALANALVGQGVTISNVTSNCADSAAGSFLITGDVGIGIPSGIILSSGTIDNVVGPNVESGISWINDMPGDTDLDTLIPGYSTEDACVLEFDFVPQQPTVSFRYVFSSDEYNEWVGSEYNDVFGFYINGVNCAKIGNSNISINSVNSGSNSAYYVNNDTGVYNTEMDGFTRVLTCASAVNVGQTNHTKLAIADAGDTVWDSNVFIATQSLISEPYGVSLSPNILNKTAIGGTVATYQLDLQNIGSNTDSYNLSLSSNLWPTTFASSGTSTATVGPLASLATTTVTVNVAIPANASSDSDYVVVTAASAASPAKTSTSFITTTIPLAMIDITPYGTLQAAYDAATSSGDIIMLKSGDPGSALGTLTANDNDKSVTVKGGYNAAYTLNSGNTIILGPATLVYGTVIFDNVAVK